MSNSTTVQRVSDNIFSILLPVLIQCFGVIILGFFAGKFKILTDSQAKGLGNYVTKFALPAIFFTVMVTLDFTGVDWRMVLAVLLGKSIMFATTFGITLIISRGRSIGLAGILSIFTSQSNDVALAYPVLRLLFPDLACYVYLFAPVQLILLNPIAYFALEWHLVREKEAITATLNSPDFVSADQNPRIQNPESKQLPAPFHKINRECLEVVRHVISNPLFFMTVIGVAFNFILHHKLPSMVEGFFQTLGDSFGATALFFLGFNMVGRLGIIRRRGIYILVLILLGKILVLPFIVRQLTVMLLAESDNSSTAKSNFNFLYAAAPTAPPVFLFASQYDVMPEVIGAGLVIGTFLFAPMMFLFAGMATLVNVDPALYDAMLERTAIYLSWASVICCTWTLVILFVGKKAFRMPYRFLICLIGCILLLCISTAPGSIWTPWSWTPDRNASWVQYIKFTVFFVAVSGSRIWTMFVGISVLMQQNARSEMAACLQLVFVLIGFGVPMIVTGVLLLFVRGNAFQDTNPVFHYGQAQLICSVVVCLVCLVVTLVCLLMLLRGLSVVQRSRRVPMTDPRCVSQPDLLFPVDQRPLLNLHPGSIASESVDLTLPSTSTSSETENVYWSSPNFTALDNSVMVGTEDQFCRFFLLLVLLMVSMFFGLIICLWRLLRETEGGVFVVVEFLDQAFNFGLGVIVFAVFGIDTELIVQPVAKCLSRIKELVLFHASGFSVSFTLPRITDGEISGFVADHFRECMSKISGKLTLPDRCLDGVFTFSSFHTWCLVKQLTMTRETSLALLIALDKGGWIHRLVRVSSQASFQTSVCFDGDGSVRRLSVYERNSLFQFTPE